MMSYFRRTIVVSAACGVLLGSPGATFSLPPDVFPAPCGTLNERVAQSDVVAIARWLEGRRALVFSDGRTDFEILKSPKSLTKAGERISLSPYRKGKSGDLFLLLGTRDETTGTIRWDIDNKVTETAFEYLTQAPSLDVPPQKRMEYFLPFLEHPDSMIADDAVTLFQRAEFKDLATLAPLLPRDKLRSWVLSPETNIGRIEIYGVLLGLCGTPDDASLMESKILEPVQEFRLGIDGVMSGYLLLTGEKGLDKLDEHKLRDKSAPFSETYAAMQALRFLWTYEPDRIPKERLRQSMRILLDRPELADLVIADLSRWGDWSVQDRLMEMYEQKEYNIPSIKRSIVRYMLQSTKVEESEKGSEPPAHVVAGKKHLEELRAADPKTVKEAERFFFLN